MSEKIKKIIRYGTTEKIDENFEMFFDYNKLIEDIKEKDTQEKHDIIEMISKAKDEDNGIFNQKIFRYIEENKEDITLEDVFTILDKAIVAKEHFEHYDSSKLISLREDFIFCIILLFKHHDKCVNSTYERFVEYLVETRIVDRDKVSIITLNWDMVIEKNISQLLENNSDENYQSVRIDYCLYDNDYEVVFENQNKDEIHLTPSIFLKVKGFKNIKLMKLHGAVNWVVCRKCQRMYYSFKSYISLNSFMSTNFPVCSKCHVRYPFDKKSITRVQADLITPTMIKDLNNVVLRNIWENAALDLSEADKLIFIGYSLPQADFEFRYLMKKFIPSNISIEVVLGENDNPELIKEYDWVKNYLPEARYRAFFGNEEITFHYDGIQGFVDRTCAPIVNE